jgi:AcrR family transcriptional regulator
MGVYYMQVLKEEVRKTIHQAALVEFYEKGFKEASMRSIAERGGMTVGNLYRYFKSKEDLFYDVISPAYHKIVALTEAENLDLNHPEEGHRFIEYIANQLIAINRAHRAELLILMEGSEGTRFEEGLQEITTLLVNKFNQNIFPWLKKNDSVNEEDDFFVHVLATNIIEGMKYIMKHCEDELKMGRLIQRFIYYHFHDILKRIM